MSKFIFALILASLALSSCKNKLDSANDLPKKRNSQRLFQEVERSVYNITSGELKGTIRVSGNSVPSLKLSSTFRILDNETFWFSVRKFGFEGARGIATKDSLKLINRLERTAIVSDYSSANKILNIPNFTLDLDAFVKGFEGRMIGNWDKADVKRSSDIYTLNSSENSDVNYTLQAKPIAPTSLIYHKDKDYLDIRYTDFRQVENGQWFPYTRNITLSNSPGDTTRLSINISSISTTDNLQFPFSIPKNYTLEDG